MKTMTIDELKKRGLKTGDIYYAKFDFGTTAFDGWYLVLENIVIGLNTEVIGAWRYKNALPNISKIILSGADKTYIPTRISKFFKTFEESLISPLITNIIEQKTVKYIHAVHFGSPKLYTWRVPEKLEKVNFKAGDIVEVDTMYGNQYVQVKETAEYEYDEETKEVINLIKADEIPF